MVGFPPRHRIWTRGDEEAARTEIGEGEEESAVKRKIETDINVIQT